MKKPAALFCAVVLTALLLVVPVQATLTTEEETSEQPYYYGYGGSSQDVREVPPGLTEADIYTGPVDNFTGVPVGAAEGDLGGDRTAINDYTGYNRERHMFFTMKSSQEVLCSVADGMTTTDPVVLLIPDGIRCSLYRNGKQVSDDFTNIKEPGFYVLSEEGLSKTELMRFTIVNSITGKLETFEVPEGFQIDSVMCNGNPVVNQYSRVSLTQEGKYVIAYSCPITETKYNFTAEIDHTPPTLALPGVDREKWQAKGPVDISDLEKGAQIGIWLGGQEMPYKKVLTQRGSYHIILEDEAGNQTEYYFIIRFYFNSSGVIFVAAILALGAGVGIYVLYSRRHLRVR